MNINGLEIVVFDVETTGLSPTDGDRIIEIAAMKVKDFATANGLDFETIKTQLQTEVDKVKP